MFPTVPLWCMSIAAKQSNVQHPKNTIFCHLSYVFLLLIYQLQRHCLDSFCLNHDRLLDVLIENKETPTVLWAENIGNSRHPLWEAAARAILLIDLLLKS